jgi:glutamate N-acetyltransferase/amino-acid N-acetyltransferase
MPVNLKYPENILPVAGVKTAVAYAGIRKKQQNDLVLFELHPDTQVAAVFTQNRFCAAPVIVARAHLNAAMPRYLLINAGNANAGTGPQGLADARECCAAMAEIGSCRVDAVLPFSTGVIGQPLPVDKLKNALPALQAALNENGWMDAAHGIMTTDTLPKVVSQQLEWNGKPVTITGIAKGAGMIRPDMATMLAFIATDVKIDAPLLNQLHRQAVNISFNRITVDGDTSTNDACVLAATGASGITVTADSGFYAEFSIALESVYQRLAQAIVRDAEGATKFVSIEVTEGASEDGCKAIAYTVAHSPLVKTALFASDANWGRILAAVGRAGVDLDINAVSITINGIRILTNGRPDPAYTEADGAKALAPEEIEIRIALGCGDKAFTVWTCDFSHEYVSINADYRT